MRAYWGTVVYLRRSINVSLSFCGIRILEAHEALRSVDFHAGCFEPGVRSIVVALGVRSAWVRNPSDGLKLCTPPDLPLYLFTFDALAQTHPPTATEPNRHVNASPAEPDEHP